VVEVVALLSLDQLERAGGLADREAAEAARRADAPATTPLLQAMVLDRAGALTEARRLAERARRILDRRADRLAGRAGLARALPVRAGAGHARPRRGADP
jgi:hypothetical protein